MSPSSIPAPTLGDQLRLVAGDIKLAHSVFALPFAVLGAFLARQRDAGWGVFAGQMAIIIVCMVAARTWAMLFNRLADRRLDALNPRTSRRVFASGRLSPRAGAAWAGASAALFLAATACFLIFFGNPWPLALGLPVLAWIALYSLTKRFTWLCHVFLGGALAASPLAAAIAVRPDALWLNAAGLWPMLAADPSPAFAVPWLALMVVLWVAGFDIIYALQDVDVDRELGLFSVPSRLGVPAALWLSRAMHAACFVALLMAWRSDPRLGVLFGVAAALVAGLLLTEHVILAKRGKAGLDMAFFTVNGIVSCLVGAAGIADLLV